jgi:DNA-directed RNA polymerase subunit alpha
MKWKNLQMPKKVELDADSNDRYGRFIVEPLERGYGITLGNSLRRVLLSSLQGASITTVRFDGVLHEFATLLGVIEDATEVILNLKQVRFKLHGDGPKKGLFERKEKGELRAGDLQIDADVEVLNPDLHIATLNTEGDLRMEVEIDAGRGYVPADQHDDQERPIGVIPVDSLFSPVLKVNYKVEQARIGQRIDFDKLSLEIWTDGSILPSDALAVSSKILRDHFNMFIHFEEPIEEEHEEVVDEEIIRMREKLERSVEELELSVRSSNCLRQAEIRSIGDLVRKTEAEMLKYRNFGRKSLKEITDVLTDMGLHLGIDLDQYYMGKGSLPKPIIDGDMSITDDTFAMATPPLSVDEPSMMVDVEPIERVGAVETVEAPVMPESPETAETLEKVATAETLEKAETAETMETAETPETMEKAETPETVETAETATTLEKAETPEPMVEPETVMTAEAEPEPERTSSEPEPSPAGEEEDEEKNLS